VELSGKDAVIQVTMKQPVTNTLFALALFILTAGAAGSAQGEVQLDSELRAHLSTLEPFHNGHITSTELANQVVVVTFFTSWCPPCRDEFHALNALREHFVGRPLRVVAINVFESFDDNDAARMERFLQDMAPGFKLLKGTDITRERFGNIDRIPTLFVFDKQGQPSMHFVHARGASKMHRRK
jgi:thiol-disulfide isomerase/thioredoxin